MNNVEIAKGVYFVGAVDWNVRDFHGYITPRGATYNAYLIVDEKICLIDTVKKPFAGEMIERIANIIDPAKIDYIVTNHIEPDHAGALPDILKCAPNAKVVITDKGREGAIKYFDCESADFQVVKEGDVLDLGRNKLHFVPLPMLHWPDSMATYLDTEEILFSNDAFGQHFSSTHRFDDENDIEEVMYEAAKYYANILLPFGRLVPKALQKAGQLPIKLIAPSHGVVWRTHIAKIIEKYCDWSAGKAQNKVVIAYDSMWGATEKMARRILDGVASVGVQGKLYRLSVADRSEVMWDIMESKGVMIGSSTLNNTVMPTVGAMLFYMKGLRPAGKIGAAFGACGWAGGSQTAIEEFLCAAGIELDKSGLALKWTPDDKEMEKCFEYGQEFGRRILER